MIQLLIELGAACLFVTVILLIDASIKFVVLRYRINRWREKHRKGPFE